MSVSNFIYDPSSSLPSISPLPPLRESYRAISFSEPDLFSQDSDQIARASACATSMFSGLAASIATKSPLPFLMGFYGCLPKVHAQQKVGTEFQVNTFTDRDQQNPAVARLSNYNFVVTWESAYQDGSGYGVFGQLFAENASRIGTEFPINTRTNDFQWEPSITSLNDGNFVVTWQSYNQDSTNTYGVYGQLFSGNATKIGSEFRINTRTGDFQWKPSVTNLSNGNFVVTWQSDGQDGSGNGVYGQLFSGNANKIGSEFRVNTYRTNHQRESSVTSLRDGNFVVIWESEGQDGSNYGIFGQLFFGNASKIGSEFQVNSYTNQTQIQPSVTSLGNDNFVVTWESDGQDGSNYGIFGQLFSGNASKLGSEFQVNTYTNQTQTQPSVTSLGNGNFVVTWTSMGQDGSNHGVFGRLFSGNASKIGIEFQVNTYTFLDQQNPSVANFNNSNFVVTWESYFQDTSYYGVFGQLFNDSIMITSTTTTSTTSTTTFASSSHLTSSTTSTTFTIPATRTSTLLSTTPLTNPAPSSALFSSSTSSRKRSRFITWISLGVSGLICFCVAPLGLFLLRKRKSQSETRLSEETGIRNTAFELDPVMERAHVVIGRTYYLLNTLTKTEAKEIYMQTGHLIPFPETQKEFFYVIGSGQFGEIIVAKRIKDGEYVAAKEVKGADNMHASEEEAQMQKEAAGENVLPIYNTIQLDNALYHFMPLAGLGDGIAIQRRIAILNRPPLALTILQFIAQNVLRGLQTIHAKRIYHLDIKPDNLVFTKDGTAYITDFGCAQRPSSRQLPGEALGDNRYFSPERLRACKEGTFDAEQADMWAAGVTLLQILYDEDPLQLFGLPSRLAARVERCDIAHFKKQLQRFYDGGNGSIWWVIKGLLDTNPKTRLTATQALEASCFRRLDKTQQERAFEELRRETFAQHQGIETSQVNLRDYGWVVSRAPEEERVQGYRSENHQQFYGYSLTPDLYQLTPDHVPTSSSSSGYQLTPDHVTASSSSSSGKSEIP